MGYLEALVLIVFIIAAYNLARTMVYVKHGKDLPRPVVTNQTFINKEDHYDEKTLTKVYEALRKAGLGNDQVINSVSEMQNAGILFRERTDGKNNSSERV